MTPRDLANIQMLLHLVKKQVKSDFTCDIDNDIVRTIWEVEDLLEKEPVELPAQEWKPYF